MKHYILLGLILTIFIWLETSCSIPPVEQSYILPPVSHDNTGGVDMVPSPEISASWLSLPLDRALERVTKKTYWLQISPTDSPISPERFTGYHTGVDFETYPSEQDSDVVVRSICTGPLISARSATGYGGVAVQRCRIEDQDVMVVYGHMRLASITARLGDILQSGQQLWVLGRGYSDETDWERKHLHLSIHRWSDIDIRWYVKTSRELDEWIDPMTYLRTE
jgi:hypothetical protein